MSSFSYTFLGDIMKKLFYTFLFLILCIPIISKAYETSATSAILMDIDSGRIFYSKDIHNKRSVASISKVMTAIIAIESGKLDDTVTIGEEILSAYGSGIYIKVGEQLTLRDLVYGLMLRSGNDAALAIAHYVGGSFDEFVNMMNEKAKELGMKNSVFNNPSGLDQEEGNYSTAYDMALLTSYAMKNEEYKKVVGTKTYKLKTNMNYYSWTNKNKLLFSYENCTGGKTGFTKIAKRTLITTASKDNLNLVAVTLNDGNDFAEHKNLFEQAFQEYANYRILKSGYIDIIGEEYYKYDDLYINSDYSYPLLESERSLVSIKYELTKKREYKSGDEVGKVIVKIADKEVYSEPIYVEKKEISKEKGFWEKIKDWFKNIW